MGKRGLEGLYDPQANGFLSKEGARTGGLSFPVKLYFFAMCPC